MQLLFEMQDRRKAEQQYQAKIEAKPKPLTRTDSTNDEPNGSDFSSALTHAGTAPETPEGVESGVKKAT
jgi:hypothetical protein